MVFLGGGKSVCFFFIGSCPPPEAASPPPPRWVKVFAMLEVCPFLSWRGKVVLGGLVFFPRRCQRWGKIAPGPGCFRRPVDMVAHMEIGSVSD